MTANFVKKIKHLSIFSIVFGLVMANFFHAFLMGSDPALTISGTYGACHSHEKAHGPEAQGPQNDLLPCCTNKSTGEATVIFALFDFTKLVYPLSMQFSQAALIDTDGPSLAVLPDPPDQVALSKIILRI